MKNKHLYPQDWADVIRPSILKRDRFKCQRCSIKHRQWILISKQNVIIKIDADEAQDYKKEGLKVYQVFLQVAHLDQNTFNNVDENLLSLCPRCHLNYDKLHNEIKRKQRKL